MPVTGGSNIPALNYLLASWGVALSDGVYEGDFTLGERDMYYATGTSLAQFPHHGTVIRKTLNDHAKEMLKAETESVPGNVHYIFSHVRSFNSCKLALRNLKCSAAILMCQYST